jgi:site-specific recombinase XerD
MEHQDLLFNEKAALLAYAGHCEPDERLFKISRQQVDLIVKKYCRDIGIRASLAHCHVLKHSLAMAMLAHNVPLPLLQKRLGHKSLASTGQYLKVSDAEASAAVQKAFTE